MKKTGFLWRQFAWNLKAYFSGKKNKKNVINLSSAEFVQRLIKVKSSNKNSSSRVERKTGVSQMVVFPQT